MVFGVNIKYKKNCTKHKLKYWFLPDRLPLLAAFYSAHLKNRLYNYSIALQYLLQCAAFRLYVIVIFFIFKIKLRRMPAENKK